MSVHASHLMDAYGACKRCLCSVARGNRGALKYPCPAICLKCGGPCDRDEVDVGVGIIHGPFGCGNCGWSEYEEYDLSSGKDPFTDDGGMIDQYGGYYPPENFLTKLAKAGKEGIDG